MPILILKGKILTPIITKKTDFYFKKCKFSIKKPRKRYYTKINAAKPMFPYSFVCYLGDIELGYRCNSRTKAKEKLTQLLQITSIGRFHNEGMGRIKWLSGCITSVSRPNTQVKRKLKIRKGLPHVLPQKTQQLIQYALLHDFYHTDKHQSKIYVEPELDDRELVRRLRNHHTDIKDPLIEQFQIYDQLSARITRKIRSPVITRYNWQASRKVDFNKLANEIKEVSKNVWKLYDYIYQSQELTLLNESLQHGHTSLRTHLLVITNLIVQDFKKLQD